MRRGRPVVVACSGASRDASLAAEVAVEAGRLLAEAGKGAVVVAIDGCRSACATRSLAARGEEVISIGLEELGGEPSAAAIAAALEEALGAGRTHGPRRVPPARPALQPGAKRAHSPEDYLQVVYALASPAAECRAVAPVLAAHVSRGLGVSRATAGEALERLEAAGLVERGAGREVLLTDAGRAAGERALWRHRVLESFLVEYMGYSHDQAHQRVDSIRDTFDDEMIERLERRLGPAVPCPQLELP
jgi:Mn-dependent DtxR family transcriptional regulator